MDGDEIAIDAEKNSIDLLVPSEELAARRARWTMPPYKAKKGALYRYIKTVKSASEGCVIDG